MNELPDEVMAEIREHVQAGRPAWEDSLRMPEEQRLIHIAFDNEHEHRQ